MRSRFVRIALSIMMVVLVGCEKSSPNTPEAVVLSFIQGVKSDSANDEFIQQHCTKSAVELYPLIRNSVTKEIKRSNFATVGSRIEGDTAQVFVVTGDNQKRTVTLINVEGAWKIRVIKSGFKLAIFW